MQHFIPGRDCAPGMVVPEGAKLLVPNMVWRALSRSVTGKVARNYDAYYPRILVPVEFRESSPSKCQGDLSFFLVPKQFVGKSSHSADY